jgi:hypothetical protein
MAAMEEARDAFLLATEDQFGDIDDRRGVMRCEVIQSEEGASGIDPRAFHIDIGKGWGFHRARSQSPDPSKQTRQQTHEALLAFGCQIPLGDSVRRRAESMPPVGLVRSKIEMLAGMPLYGAGADIALAGGRKIEGLPEYPRGDQLSARETRQRLCNISIDHQPRRRSPPPESLLKTRAWETLSPRQQSEHTLEAERYALLLGRDTLRRERIEDVAPRMLKDNLSSNSTASSVTTRSPRAGWNKYFYLQKSGLDATDQSPRIENEIARWYKANYAKSAQPALCTTSSPMTKSRRAKKAWVDNEDITMSPSGEESDAGNFSPGNVSTAPQTAGHSLESSPAKYHCVVKPPSECSPEDLKADDMTPAAITAAWSPAECTEMISIDNSELPYWSPRMIKDAPMKSRCSRDQQRGNVSPDPQSPEHSVESSLISCHCLVKPPSDSSPKKEDGEADDITPAATTAGCSTAGSSPPSSTPPVPFSPPVPESELIVSGKITIPARLQAGHPMKSPRKCQIPVVLAHAVSSPSKQQLPLQKVKTTGTPSRPQPRDQQRVSHGQASGAMSTPVPGMYRPASSFSASSAASGIKSPAVREAEQSLKVNVQQRVKVSENRAALARVKALKARLSSSTFDLGSVQRELAAVEKMLQ